MVKYSLFIIRIPFCISWHMSVCLSVCLCASGLSSQINSFCQLQTSGSFLWFFFFVIFTLLFSKKIKTKPLKWKEQENKKETKTEFPGKHLATKKKKEKKTKTENERQQHFNMLHVNTAKQKRTEELKCWLILNEINQQKKKKKRQQKINMKTKRKIC